MIYVENRELMIPRNERCIGTNYDNNVLTRTFYIKRAKDGDMDIAGLAFMLRLEYKNDENVVEHLNGRHDLYLDVETNTPLLVFDVERDGHVYKLVLQINKALNAKDQTGSKQKITGNLRRTIVIEELVNLTNGKRYEFLGSKK